MNLPVIVIGAGGHAKVLLEALRIQSVTVLGLTDQASEKTSQKVLGIEVIGADDLIMQHPAATVLLVNGLGAVGETVKRRAMFDKFKDLGYNFAAVVHPSAVISSDVELEEGAQIMAGAVIQPGVQIGRNTIVNTRASVDHDCIIGDHVHLAPGVILSGGVQVSEGVHIGSGAIVIQGIRIGQGSVIGAGAVVLADVPEGATVVGVPARKV